MHLLTLSVWPSVSGWYEVERQKATPRRWVSLGQNSLTNCEPQSDVIK